LALTVSSIQSDVSVDVRQVLSSTDSKLIQWVDRIHKDCLHSSVYSYLNISTTSFSTVVAQQQYTLAPTNIRRILGMYDQTRNRILFPIERATSPTSQVEKQEPGAGQASGPDTKYGQGFTRALSLQSGQPEYFRHIGAQTVSLFPIPNQVVSVGVSYEQQVVTLVNTTDTLVIPEDGRDMVVAGVDWLANAFLKRTEEAAAWMQVYQSLKTGQSLT
jgi:hypothetical protein